MARARADARRLVARGRVQGVFFREEMRQHAEAERLRGWVTNRDDGALEAWLEGEPEAIERVVSWARSGPREARVDEIAVESVEPRGHTDFAIR